VCGGSCDDIDADIGQELVDQWYAEEAKFDYSKPEETPGRSC